MAGWTLLVGARYHADGNDKLPVPVTFRKGGGYQVWLGEGLSWVNSYPTEHAGAIGRLTRNSATGNLEGDRDGSKIEIGVYNGRFRLRSSYKQHHIIIVAGDPNWTDYQVDCDVFDKVDRVIMSNDHLTLTEPNYKKFGIFGRVNVPNLPVTMGEHTELGVEFGNYSNHIVKADIGTDSIQIRLKAPDVDFHRESSTRLGKRRFSISKHTTSRKMWLCT